ncbi:FIST N-terminal domain-containing protein [Curvibacter sp. APW13]|uniref:FIST signal transduction protein n=1 Tax=Curvibacter sp. APW13 TaxID=3077236 RepID=UPI0028DE11DB|nr:FIST C-terminal domain-containing protein [Curvibacter sp. APW13]MDT8991829.1 FIST N-terminal domain-containing protein [Curvibacter sp. APW13]
MIVDQQYVALEPGQVDATVQAWQARYPDLGLLVLLPEQEQVAVPWLQEVCRTRAIPLMGAIFPALVVEDGFRSQGAWLVCFDTCPSHVLQAPLDEAGREQLRAWTADVVQRGVHRPTVFFVFDAMIPDIGTVLDGLHLGLDTPAHYVGVNAGSETFTDMPCLFDAERLLGHGVLAINLGAQVVTAVRHAYPVSQALMRATAAQGNRILQIDGRPAFEVYQEVVAREYRVALTRENFYDYAVHFPFGVITVVDVLVRIPVGLGEDQSLFCVGEIAPHAALRLLRAPHLQDSECVHELLSTLGQGLRQANAAQRGLMTFYCAGRRMHFGGDADTELAGLRRDGGVPHLFGALSLGEIDSIEDLDAPRFHNAALVCVASP